MGEAQPVGMEGLAGDEGLLVGWGVCSPLICDRYTAVEFPQNASATTGCPMDRTCTRIWWVRPVLGRSRR